MRFTVAGETTERTQEGEKFWLEGTMYKAQILESMEAERLRVTINGEHDWTGPKPATRMVVDISGNLLIRSGSHTPGVPAMGTFKVDIMADLELHIRTDFEPNVLLDYLKLNIDFSKKITASDGSGVLSISGSARVLYPCETCMSFSASAVFFNFNSIAS